MCGQASAATDLAASLHVAVTVPPQPCKITTQNAFSVDATGKPVLSPTQLTTNCTGGSAATAPANTLFTQQTLADGSYVATINF